MVALQAHIDLSCANTMRLPAIARYFVELSSSDELESLVEMAERLQLPIHMIGSGSNLLFKPEIDGIVARWRSDEQVHVLESVADECLVSVAAGYDWHQWVCRSIEFGHGLENLALIPGTVGAAPIQNIGAYGVEVGTYIAAVEGFQISTGEWLTLTSEQCQFGYRDSIFKQRLKNDFIITRVIFRLSSLFKPCLSYGPLQSLTGHKGKPTPQELINSVCRIRQQKLPSPDKIANVGSFFKNPVVPVDLWRHLQHKFVDIPSYPIDAQAVKIPAAWLIEQCGWKGVRQGCVGMHDQQALVMTAENAVLTDVLNLQADIQKSVHDKFMITLEREPEILG